MTPVTDSDTGWPAAMAALMGRLTTHPPATTEPPPYTPMVALVTGSVMEYAFQLEGKTVPGGATRVMVPWSAAKAPRALVTNPTV